jgi:hypothetical protein
VSGLGIAKLVWSGFWLEELWGLGRGFRGLSHGKAIVRSEKYRGVVRGEYKSRRRLMNADVAVTAEVRCEE